MPIAQPETAAHRRRDATAAETHPQAHDWLPGQVSRGALLWDEAVAHLDCNARNLPD